MMDVYMKAIDNGSRRKVQDVLVDFGGNLSRQAPSSGGYLANIGVYLVLVLNLSRCWYNREFWASKGGWACATIMHGVCIRFGVGIKYEQADLNQIALGLEYLHMHQSGRQDPRTGSRAEVMENILKERLARFEPATSTGPLQTDATEDQKERPSSGKASTVGVEPSSSSGPDPVGGQGSGQSTGQVPVLTAEGGPSSDGGDGVEGCKGEVGVLSNGDVLEIDKLAVGERKGRCWEDFVLGLLGSKSTCARMVYTLLRCCGNFWAWGGEFILSLVVLSFRRETSELYW